MGDLRVSPTFDMSGAIDIHAALAIDGWMSPAELFWLAERARGCERGIIEVGCWRGRSTRALADHSPGPVFAVDPWFGTYFNEDGTPNAIQTNVFPTFQRNLEAHILSGQVRPVHQRFLEVAPALMNHVRREFGGGVDLVFLDGDHRYETVKREIEIAKAFVRSGGILAGHDYGFADWPGVKRAVDELLGSSVRFVDSIWWVEV